MFVIYLIVNKLNGKVYIGKTGQSPWRRRWVNHRANVKALKKTYLYDSIRCYGECAFDIVKIDETTTNELADELEKHYIAIFESSNPEKGYNLTFGGDGATPNQETRIKMSNAKKGKSPGNKGKKASPEVCHKLSLALKGKVPWISGKNHTPEARQKISLGHTGIPLSLEHRAKIAAANKGRIVSPETREKIAARHRGKTQSQEAKNKVSAANKGRRHSEEVKARMSASQRKRRNQEYEAKMNSTITKLGGNLESPRQSKPSDFPAVGPTGPEGMASGAGQLVKLTEAQESPRSTQDSGDQTPSDWSKDTWKVGKSSSEAGTSVKAMCSVDFETGKHNC